MLLSLRGLLLATVLPFSVHAALEPWTHNGSVIQAECLGVKGDYVVFKKADGTRLLIPHAKLTAADQRRVEGLEFKSSGNTVTIAPAKTIEPSEFSRIGAALQGKLVTLNGRALQDVKSDRLAGTQFYAIYYSAGWCGPCRRFTPELVKAYPAIKAAHPEFEVIFVSADRGEDEMKHYMMDDRMPWPGLRYREAQTNPTLNRYQQSGIPNLVFIDGNGQILSKSYDDKGRYLGPMKVLADIRRHFKM